VKKILVVAPHPDDETLGCGGSILRFLEEGLEVHWLIVTGKTESGGYTSHQIECRKIEIDRVAKAYSFSSVHQLGFPAASLDTISAGEIIQAISRVVSLIQPQIVLTAYRNDAHSDHADVFDAVMSATKNFRTPFVEKILCYETLSETNFGCKPEDVGFKANVFVDITPFLEKKMEIMAIFESEMADFPFPRSDKALRSLAYLRGTQCNAEAAEAFFLVKEII
jgi:N-acetylglucosamine malate deacetylase 1